MRQEWKDFTPGVWQNEINVRDFIQKNYTPYEGDESFLQGPTKETDELWAQVMDLTAKEREAGGVLDMAPASSPPSPPMVPAIWTRAKRRSWASRPISPSSVLCSPTAASAWP